MKNAAVFMTAMLLGLATGVSSRGAEFVHPGMDQGGADLTHLKQKVQRGEQPWKEAFDKLKAGTNLDFKLSPVTHISQGGYGANDQGGKHLSAGSRLAYDCALVWYLGDDEAYARKAMEIIRAW